ncbi:hypothetical protein JR316_0004360 [Psilocybe cubensis]|uniref:Uncharacterized protein n=1 Tax=Psilocybe cubensis TaxID=181762 RepID=A0ACB8H3N4_PSICU|nr:hypothetical protein JR316_0004360 [Psilocybe cubensis]KAH9482262.1 hypothetical protein JR316_0004360 [Psilocybe cubensis]
MKTEWEALNVKYEERQQELREIQTQRDEEATRARIRWEEERLLEVPKSKSSPKKTEKVASKQSSANTIQGKVENIVAQRLTLPKGSKLTKISRKTQIASLSADQARTLLISLWERMPAVENVLDAELCAMKAGSSKVTDSTVDPSTWTGMYDVEAPMIVSEQDYHWSGVSTLEIYPSSTSAHLWASFEFGVLKGVMRSLHPVPKYLNSEIFFEYRGYEAGEDTMTFSDDNRAIVTFLPGGFFEGKINTECFGTFRIYGALKVQTPDGKPIKRKSLAQQKQSVKSWKADFRSINYRNYEIAGKARWGGWGGDTQDDKAFESDTTDGHKKHEEIDLNKFMKKPMDDLNGEDGSESDSNSEDQDRQFGYDFSGF